MTPWLTKIWETDKDFLYWDVGINSKNIDKKRTVVNQSITLDNGIYRSACTMMSSYSAILSLFNKKENRYFKKNIINNAVENWYIIGKGRTMFEWVKSVCKLWNKNYKEKVMYVRMNAWSKDFYEVLKKWYWIIMWYRKSSEYSKDKKDDWIVNTLEFENRKSWHCISTYHSNKHSRTHLDTYPDYKYNIYQVDNGNKLIDKWVYEKYCYAILPWWDEFIKNLKIKKIDKAMKLLSLINYDRTKDKKYLDIYKMF